ncbi:MAG: hypothetical protein BWY64_01639 [bacterium ADurb.Bin363]|nr:MAG: hypothetical protein BWY64_01639 [bacterium ADurb.Bin363]
MKIGSNLNVQTDQKVRQNSTTRVQNPDNVSIGDFSRNDILVSYYPQDPYVGKPVITSIPGDDITPGPDNSKIDTIGNVKPDADGNLIFEPHEPAFVNAQVFTSVNSSIDMFQKYLGREVKFYGGRKKITIYPDKGEMRNAYYSRMDCSLNFFHYTDKKTGQIYYTGKSSEITAHESGHSKIDGIHPGWLGWNQETRAVHEAGADIDAMLTGLHDENNLERFLQETGGDFKKPNIIAYMGEEFGYSAYGRPYLRTAINDFTYSPPELLPDHPAPDQLGGEAHSFAQLFTGAFYDVLEGVFNSYLEDGLSQKEALIKTREVGGKLYAKGVDTAPPSNATYKDLALAMLNVDKREEGGKHSNIIADVFTKRKILTQGDLEKTRFTEDLIRGNNFLFAGNSDNIIDFVDKNREVFGIGEEVPLILSNTRKNNDGSAGFDVSYSVEVLLKGSEYGIFDGAVIDVDGGVNLGTYSSGQLCFASTSEVNNDNIEKSKNYLKKLIKDGRIKFVDPSSRKVLKNDDFFDSKGIPYAGYTSYEDGKMKIERTPVIV